MITRKKKNTTYIVTYFKGLPRKNTTNGLTLNENFKCLNTARISLKYFKNSLSINCNDSEESFWSKYFI